MIIQNNRIHSFNIYNMNEKEWMLDNAESVKVIVSKQHEQIEKMIDQTGNKDSATAVDCVSADGFVLSSLFIF